MKNSVQEFYGNKIRVRVCAICLHNEQLLMVNHKGIAAGDFWAPPGGGLNFEETAVECITREMMEETNIKVEVQNFLFACELIKTPLHAIELFFRVRPLSFDMQTGTDPETGSPSIIKEVKFMSRSELEKLNKNQLHGIFRFINNFSDLEKLIGYFRIE